MSGGTRVKRFVEGQDRAQLVLLPECLDDFVGEDNPVRVVDAFIEELDLAALGFDGVVPEVLGDPASHEGIPVKLFLHLRLRSRLSAVAHFNVRPRWSSRHSRALPCEPPIRRNDVPTTVPHSGRESSRRAAPLYETAAFARPDNGDAPLDPFA